MASATKSGRSAARKLAAGLLVLGCAAAVGGCGEAGSPVTTDALASTSAAPGSSSPAQPSGPAQPSSEPATPSASPTPTGPPKFASKVSKVERSQVRYSWRPGCPVGLNDLRLVTLTYWGFDDKPHTGQLVVNRRGADDIVAIFKQLYGWRFPVKQMKLVDAYKASDYDSIDADNTSAFNCRQATGSSSWSKHAYGEAVDLNPRENPYVTAGGGTAHRNARKFVDRPVDAPGAVNGGDRVVKLFDRYGWEWGGYWAGTKDYQHFSKGGG